MRSRSTSRLISTSAACILTASLYAFSDTGAAPEYWLIWRRSEASVRPPPDSVIR